ncbi:MAG: hypothetical protein WCO25_02630 [Candidatus Uhrbacteria bacterium]
MPFDITNLAIPMWTFLGAYGLFLAVFSLYSLFNLYHLVRFGTASTGLYAVTALFAGGTVLLVGATVFLLAPYDWSASISVSDLLRQTASTKQFFPGK